MLKNQPSLHRVCVWRRFRGKEWTLTPNRLSAIVVFIFCLGAAPARTDMLLVTIKIPGHEFAPIAVVPAYISFGEACEPFPGKIVLFTNEYTADQVGTVYEVPSDLVAEMAPIFSDPGGAVRAVNMTDAWGPVIWSEFWDSSPNIMLHVPQRGLGLEGYLVTRITQTVNYITWTLNGSDLNGNAQQSVRIYGVVVPEPSTVALALSALLIKTSFR